MAVVAECVAEHNARPGRTSEAAFGRSLDEAFDEAMARVVMRRLAPAQARLLLMTAERVRVQANATVTLKIGHTPGQPRNRYHDPLLVERAGETLVARIDPDDLHGRILLHDEQGRFVCAAGCLHPVGWKDTASAKTYERGRRRMDTASRKAVAARRDMDALIEALRQVPTPTTATPVEPAATRLVTDSNLPQLPPAMPIDKEGLLERIEARRREFGMSPADLGLLILNALGKQVVSPGQLSAANLERLLGQLDEGVTWVEPSAEITPAPAPTSPGRGNSFMTALKRVQQAEENFG